MKKLFTILFLFFQTCSFAQNIEKLAGNGTAGSSGDNGPATNAELFGPYGIGADAAGNVYVADRFNHRIRMVATTGIITTICGTGSAGYNGDDIAASTAQLNDPNGIAVTPAGIIYVADRGNNRVRKIDVSGIITTIAGTGVYGYNGDGGDANTSTLAAPRGVSVDGAGNVYIADQENNRLREVLLATGKIYTVAGNGVLGFGGDSGPATAASFNGIYASAIDAAGNIYICDVDNARVRKVSTTGIVTTIAGVGVISYNGDDMPATDAQLAEPIAVAIDGANDIIIADAWNSRIRRVNSAGIITTIVGSGILGDLGDGGAATACRMYYPYGMTLTSNRRLLISDHGNNRVRYVDLPTTGIDQVAAQNGINVFPNPSVGGRFTIDLSSLKSEEVSVVITDMIGRKVYGLVTSAGKLVDVNASLIAGIYMVSVRDAVGQYKKQLVVSGK